LKILIIDNFDSFTYNLVDYVKQCGAECEVIRNNIDGNEINIKKYKGLILSPGPGIPKEAGNLLNFVDIFHTQLPILGICLGHQALGNYFGANLVKSQKPMHGKISEINCYSDLIFKNIPSKIEVVRYHSLILTDLPDCLDRTAETSNEEIMGITHKSLSIKGLQFHPEAALTKYGIKMIQNWIEFVSEQNNF